MATPQHRNPCPGVIKFTILLEPSLFQYNKNILSLSNQYPDTEKNGFFFFKKPTKNINVTSFTLKLISLGMGNMNFTIFCFSPLHVQHVR